MKELHRSRLLAFHAQGGRCIYCHYEMWLRSPIELIEPYGYTLRQAWKLKCTAEHLVPKSEGGSDAPANIVAACHHCNATRHKRKSPPAPERYVEIVQNRLNSGRWHPFPRKTSR